MKGLKKILILTLIIAIPNVVLAESYTKYSDYYYSDTRPNEQENLELEVERRYKYYYTDKVYDSTIYSSKQDIEEFPNEEIYYSEEKRSIDRPEDSEIIAEKYVTTYKDYEKVKHLIMYAVRSQIDTKIYEIDIFYKGEEIDYKVDCLNNICDYEFMGNLNNGIYEDEYAFLKANSTIHLEFDDEYNPYDLEVIFYVDGTKDSYGGFRFLLNNDGYQGDFYFSDVVNIRHIGEEVRSFNVKDMPHDERYTYNTVETDIDSDEVVLDGEFVSKDLVYVYKDIYYRYYKEEVKYLDGYYTELKDFTRDENNYKEFYKYRYKEEIEVPEKVVEVIKEVEVPVEVIKEVEVPVEVIKEVEVPVEVIKEVEVPVEVIKEVEVPVEVIKEVEVPVEVIKEVEVPVEVIKEVEVPVEVIKEVEVPVEIIKEIPVEVVKEIEKIITYEKEIPIEKIVEVPYEVTVEKEVVREIEKDKIDNNNYFIQYIFYMGLGLILKKMSFFR